MDGSLFSITLIALVAPLCLQGAAPVIFYSDLEGGPNTNGERNAGAYVSIRGRNFGTARGGSYVTIGSGRAAAYPLWSDTKITFQLGPEARSGNIIVVSGSVSSNGVPFAVRSGKIYFVSVSGSDGNSGSIASPWATMIKARNTMAPGDITYVLDGVKQTILDDWAASMLLRTGWCSSGLPRALVAYPGATATLGAVNGPAYGLRGADSSGGACQGGWVFAGLQIRGSVSAVTLMGPSSNWRFVANDMSCPDGDGGTACFAGALSSHVAFLGNSVHDTGKAGASALYHGVYFSTDSNHLDIGWNTIANVRGCRGLQVHSNPLYPNTGYNEYDISIHDNLIHDTQCDGIVLATVDPSQGKVELYNNIIYNAGKGPANPENTGDWACVYVAGMTNAGRPGGGTVELYNNTFFNCGSFATPPYNGANGAIRNGGGNPNLTLRLRNNILYQSQAAPYLLGPAASFTGSNNLFFGNGAPPPGLANSVNKDPRFFDLLQKGFHLSWESPARHAGIETGISLDREGNPRGGTAGTDLGALQYVPPALKSIACVPAVVATPGTATCDIRLDGIAPTGGTQVPVAADCASVAIPPIATISDGLSDAIVQVSVGPVRVPTAATITAGDTSGSRAFLLWLMPSDPVWPLLLAASDGAAFEYNSVSPGGVITLFGANLGPESPLGSRLEENGRVGTLIENTRVLFDGIPAPLIYIHSAQISAVAPYRLADRDTVQVEVEIESRRSNPLSLPVAQTTPGIFTLNASGKGPAVLLNEGGGLNTPFHPACKDSTVVFYAAGLGQTDPPGVDGLPGAEPLPRPLAPITVLIGGLNAEVLYAGAAPAIVAGVFQINARIPPGAPSGDTVPLTIYAQNVPSQPGVTIAIE